jgi:hypothetical protein
LPTVLKTWRFDSDLEGLVDSGASLTSIAYLGTDGNPSSGCCRITMSIVGGAVLSEYARKATTTDTWETWGVPSGATVTSVQATGARGNQQGTATIVAQMYVRVVDQSAVSVHGSTLGADDLIAEDIAFFGSSWADVDLNGVKPVLAGKSASTQSVRLEIQADVGSISGVCDFRFDTFELTITYTGGSSGGGGGGGGGGTGGGDTGDDTFVEPGGGVVPEADCGNQFDTNVLYGIDYDKANAYTWMHDNRLYLSMGRRTLVYDTQIAGGGWADTSYGNVRQGIRIQVPNHEEWMFLLMPGPLGGNAFNYVAYSSAMLKPGMNNVTNVGLRQVYIGPFDGKGTDRTSTKRAVRLRVWGEYDNPGQEIPIVIGTLTMYSDSGYSEQYPILPLARSGFSALPNPPRVMEPGLVVEQCFRTAMQGRVLWGVLEFTEPCVSVRDQMLEYVRLEARR